MSAVSLDNLGLSFPQEFRGLQTQHQLKEYVFSRLLMQQPTPMDSIAAHNEAVMKCPSPTTSPSLPIPPPQTSALLRLPGEIRNRVYDYVLDTFSVNDLLFEEAHALASTSRQLRAEFWPFFLSRAIFRVDLRNYAGFFSTFYPPAAPAIMRTYVGNFTFTVPSRGAAFVANVTTKGEDAQGRSLDLLPLVVLLRAAPLIRFTLDAECTWLCPRKSLRALLNYVRTSPTWVVAPLLDALTLRMREAQMAPGTWETYWIVDVGLKRDLWWVYETLGLLAWVGMRGDKGRERVTFYVSWDREVEAVGRRRRWFGRVKRGFGRMWRRVRGLKVKESQSV
ncbi:hypothetical protein P171DRAFT_518599 [Karstenula rhodostoma CBS 690.94]|uniref:F-box domain-containing protein n=1 Tax=Karstenula rhodostoma CBS 690.94 TaxID=1392251 RepID=A0A9P4UFQ8_9PLEO|nr:hypothetical protein P171DRAFT_518599 [Karstenula rhodostoma CBS 690.94]